MKLNDIKQLICLHYLPASDREPIIKETVEKLGIDCVEIYESIPLPYFDQFAKFHRLKILKNINKTESYYDKVGVFNCSLSWYSIFKKLQYRSSQQDIYLLIEDDIIIKNIDLLKEILEELPDNFDIARCCVTRYYPTEQLKKLDIPVNQFWNKQEDHDNYVNCYWGCTGFMLVKKNGIDFFCKFIEENGYCPADHPFMNTKNINHYIINPKYNNIAVVEGSYTGLVNSRVENNIKDNIYIYNLNGRFANQLFPIFCALTLFDKYPEKFNKPTFIIDDRKKYHHPDIIDDVIKSYFSDILNFEDGDCKLLSGSQIIKNSNNNIEILKYRNISFIDYCQDINLIDEIAVQKYIKVPENIKKVIYNLYGDISDFVSLHVRRGDFLSRQYRNTYVVLDKDYIEKVIDKYFPDNKIICISDDINWCKNNITRDNIIFADKIDNYLVDFFIQTLTTKGNICSGSTFSIAGAILNPSKDKLCIVPDPFFKQPIPEINIIPDYAIRESLI